jgi:hypothetical protein
MESKLAQNQVMLDGLATDMVREKNDKMKIGELLKPLKSENIMLRRQLRFLTERKMGLEKKTAELEMRNSELQKKLSEMNSFLKDKGTALAALDKKIETAETTTTTTTPAAQENEEAVVTRTEPVELPPIIVRPTATEEPGPASGSFTCKIIAVNKESNFVVIDLGADAGVKVGDTFQVYRDGGLIAALQVIQIRRGIAACDIKKGSIPLKVGDTVR